MDDYSVKGKVNILEILKDLSNEEILEIYNYIMAIVNKKD